MSAMQRKHSSRIRQCSALAIAMGCVVALAAVPAASSRPAEQSAPVASAATPRVEVKVAMIIPRLASLPVFKAATALAKKNIWVKWVYFQSDGAISQAFAAGAVDMTISNPAALANLNAAGMDVRMFSVNWASLDWFLIGKREIPSLRSLEGRTIGISTPGSTTDVLTTLALTRAGVPKDRISMVSIGGTAARAGALEVGRIDAAWIGSDSAYPLLFSSDKFKVIGGATVSKLFPGYLSTGWTAPKSYIDRNPRVITEIVRAMIQANRWAQNEKSFVQFAQRVKIPGIQGQGVEALTWAEKQFLAINMFPVNGGITQTAFDTTYRILLEAREIKAAPAFNTVATAAFQNQVLKQIGLYKPPKKK